jgi:hypothetical protein
MRSCFKSPVLGGGEAWTPAYAGVTKPRTVIPAQAGIQAPASGITSKTFKTASEDLANPQGNKEVKGSWR